MDNEREAYRYEEPRRASGHWGAPFFLLGALAGASAALIVTPWKGEKVRGKLLEVSRSTKDSIRGYMQSARKTRTEELEKAIDSAIEAGKEQDKRI